MVLVLALAACEQKIASSLSLGEAVTVNGLELWVDRFETSQIIGTSTPRSQGKFLLVHVGARNVRETPTQKPVNVHIRYRGGEVDRSFRLQLDLGTTDPTHPSFPYVVDLFPGAQSEGWTGFEVPAGLDPSEVAVLVKVDNKVASWCLTEPKNQDVC
ncbi:MAG: hypothetical protein ACE5IZ_10015 [Dehalococcoidia bacterium]